MKNTLKTLIIITILGALNLFCTTTTPVPAPPTQTITPTITPTLIPPTSPPQNIRYVSMTGNDANPGTLEQPWRTMQKAVETITAGDLVYIRKGQYDGLQGGWVFQNSGTQAQPITLTNYPGEQVIFKITNATAIDHYIFRCSINPHNPLSWQTPKADYIRITGSDVEPQILSNGVESWKGIVIQGMEGEQSAGIYASDCDHWEISGVDFVETAYGIFTEKNNWHQPQEHSTDSWHVYDNRVYNYYRESGMQFNGNYNLIENNEIYKVSNQLDTPYGCQLLNLVGNNNIVRGNIFSRMGSTAECLGILFEWDLSDANLIEQNIISDVPSGIVFQGGDANIIRDNSITASAASSGSGIKIASYDNRIVWPCNDYFGSGSSSEALIPPDDPAHPDYPYYYNPRNCHSMNNQIVRNTIQGFETAWLLGPAVEDSNIFTNNLVLPP